MAKINVNDSCIGCGACTGICPDVFDLSDEGVAYSVVGEDLADDLVDGAKEAAESCPVEAISVE